MALSDERVFSGKSKPYLALLLRYVKLQNITFTYDTNKKKIVTAWSCPTLGLACVLMWRPISPELVLSPDF